MQGSLAVVLAVHPFYAAAMQNELVSAGAHNLADWHDVCLGSLGIETHRTSSIWLCEEPAPFIYLSAITLREDPGEQQNELERLMREAAHLPIAVCDCWSALDLVDLGFQKFETEAWYVRQPDELSHDLPLEVERVTEPAALSEFERANTDGFEEPELHELGPFGVYGPAILRDPRLRVFVRREQGQVVSGAIGCVSSGVVGVYAVATVPAFRRRGYGEDVTWAAVGSEPSLPAILQPSVEGAALYRRMGFSPVGLYTKWLRLP